MIIDLETGNRPVWRYYSFNELLYAWSQDPQGVDITFSYYTMFCAFENIRERLLSGKMDCAEKLRIILKNQPGSLFEISDKIQKIIGDPDVIMVYKWFIQEEINSLLRIAVSKLKQFGDESLIDAIKKRLVRAIDDRSLFDRFVDRDKKWIQYITNVSGYRNVR